MPQKAHGKAHRKDDVAPRMSIEFSKVFPANAVEIRWMSLFLHLSQLR